MGADKSIQRGFQFRDINGAVLRKTFRAAKLGENEGNGAVMQESAVAILSDVTCGIDTATALQDMVTGDRDLIFLFSRWEHQKRSKEDAGAGMDGKETIEFDCTWGRTKEKPGCGARVSYTKDWGDVLVAEPEEGTDELVWVRGVPCFKFSDPERGIQSCTMRHTTGKFERDSLTPALMADFPIGPSRYVFEKSIVEFNGKAAITDEEVKRLGRSQLFTFEDIEAMRPKPLEALQDAVNKHRFGPKMQDKIFCPRHRDYVWRISEAVTHFFDQDAMILLAATQAG